MFALYRGHEVARRNAAEAVEARRQLTFAEDREMAATQPPELPPNPYAIAQPDLADPASPDLDPIFLSDAIAGAADGVPRTLCDEDDSCLKYVTLLKAGTMILSGAKRHRAVTQAVAVRLSDAWRDAWARQGFEDQTTHRLWSIVLTATPDERFAAAVCHRALEGAYNVARDKTLRAEIRDRFNEQALQRWTDAMSVRQPHNPYPDPSRPTLRVHDSSSTPALEQMPEWDWSSNHGSP